MTIRENWFARWRDELAAGVSSGFLLALSFPPFPTRFLAAVALVPLLRYYLVKPRPGLRRAIGLGFILGVSFFAPLLFWISELIPESGVTMPWIMAPALALLVAYLSCYTALFTLALSFCASRFGARGVVAAPALWSLVEYARSRGFPRRRRAPRANARIPRATRARARRRRRGPRNGTRRRRARA